jgi:hypothetical protein
MWLIYLLIGFILWLRETKFIGDRLRPENKSEGFFVMSITTGWLLLPLMLILWPVYVILELNEVSDNKINKT